MDNRVKSLKNMIKALRVQYKQNIAVKTFYHRVSGLSKGIFMGFLLLHTTQITERFTFEKYGFIDQISTYLYQNYQVNVRMSTAYDKILEDMLMNDNIHKADAHMYAGLGQSYASLQNPEFAYQAYMIAHYKEPKTIKGNSDIKLDFISKGKQQSIISEGRNINELLDTLQE